MLRKKTKKVIEENISLESNEAEFSSEEAREISLAIKSYTGAAKWFESHIADEFQKKTKRANRLSLFFGALAIISVIAVACIAPLKKVVPFVIRVDNASGYTDIVQPGAAVTTEQRDDEYWATLYIIQHESYNFSNQDLRYQVVELMSYPDVFAEYKNFQLSKKGYLSVLGDSRQIRVEINNVPVINRGKDKKSGIMQIRFTKTVLDAKGQPVEDIPPTKWLATISYDYNRQPKNKGDEWMNPRGFGVKSYVQTQEVGY
jgi:type IV secretion system protein VirB8